MTGYEALSLTISIAALLYAAFADWRRRKDEKRLRQLEEKIAEDELRRRKEARQAAQRADVDVTLERRHGGWRLVVVNKGEGVAEKVNISSTDGNSPIVGSEWQRKNPIKRLTPGDEVTFIAAVDRDTQPPFEFELRWRDEDGTARSRDKTVYG